MTGMQKCSITPVVCRQVQISCIIVQFVTQLNQFLKWQCYFHVTLIKLFSLYENTDDEGGKEEYFQILSYFWSSTLIFS